MGFKERKGDDVELHDELICYATIGDRIDDMYLPWVGSGGSAHLFFVGAQLFARGTKYEKHFAKGFVNGWKSAMRAECRAE